MVSIPDCDATPGGLLNTIKVPRNLTILTYCLPEANYENDDPNRDEYAPRTCRGEENALKPRDLQIIREAYQHSRSESRHKSVSRRQHQRTPMSRVGSQIVSSSEVNVKLTKPTVGPRRHDSLAGVYRYITPHQYHRVI